MEEISIFNILLWIFDHQLLFGLHYSYFCKIMVKLENLPGYLPDLLCWTKQTMMISRRVPPVPTRTATNHKFESSNGPSERLSRLYRLEMVTCTFCGKFSGRVLCISVFIRRHHDQSIILSWWKSTKQFLGAKKD